MVFNDVLIHQRIKHNFHTLKSKKILFKLIFLNKNHKFVKKYY